MLINNKFLKYFSFVLSFIFIMYVFYLIVSSFFIVKNQFIDIGDSTYVNQVRVDEYTKNLSSSLSKNCKSSELCEIQKMLDFTTYIPYKINESIARSSKQVVKQNYGDCDDKSNLLISLLIFLCFLKTIVSIP